jgi:hypothetical protein
MAANKENEARDNDTKKIFAKLTAEVIERRIPA